MAELGPCSYTTESPYSDRTVITVLGSEELVLIYD